MSLRLAVVGAGGRMGQAVVRAALLAGHSIVGAVEHAESPVLGLDAGEVAHVGPCGALVSADLASALLGADACVDFSLPAGFANLAAVCARAKVALISGTTGKDEFADKPLAQAAQKIPVLWSPNMSLGVHVLAELVRDAVMRLPDFDVEITETHHRKKIDSPSGTAKRLYEAVREARHDAHAIAGRDGIVGARTDTEIGMLAIRGGDVIGDHSVHLLGIGERLELTHRATSRELFARGAVRAASVIAKLPAGRYTMTDVTRVITQAAKN